MVDQLDISFGHGYFIGLLSVERGGAKTLLADCQNRTKTKLALGFQLVI